MCPSESHHPGSFTRISSKSQGTASKSETFREILGPTAGLMTEVVMQPAQPIPLDTAASLVSYRVNSLFDH